MHVTFKPLWETSFHFGTGMGALEVGNQVEKADYQRLNEKPTTLFGTFYSPCLLVERIPIPFKIRVPLHPKCLRWTFFCPQHIPWRNRSLSFSLGELRIPVCNKNASILTCFLDSDLRKGDVTVSTLPDKWPSLHQDEMNSILKEPATS